MFMMGNTQFPPAALRDLVLRYGDSEFHVHKLKIDRHMTKLPQPLNAETRELVIPSVPNTGADDMFDLLRCMYFLECVEQMPFHWNHTLKEPKPMCINQSLVKLMRELGCVQLLGECEKNISEQSDWGDFMPWQLLELSQDGAWPRIYERAVKCIAEKKMQEPQGWHSDCLSRQTYRDLWKASA